MGSRLTSLAPLHLRAIGFSHDTDGPRGTLLSSTTKGRIERRAGAQRQQRSFVRAAARTWHRACGLGARAFRAQAVAVKPWRGFASIIRDLDGGQRMEVPLQSTDCGLQRRTRPSPNLALAPPNALLAYKGYVMFTRGVRRVVDEDAKVI